MENQLVELKNGNRKAQKAVYERYAPTMLGVCRSYFNNLADAEATMVQGFFKVFTKVGQYNAQGSFEGWIRRIMVRECLNELRRSRKLMFLEDQDFHQIPDLDEAKMDFNACELLDQLPQGYRTVFNLYVIEGYSHQEIAEELGINLNTSKSQLRKAKIKIRELLLSRQTIKSQRHVKD